MSAKARKRRSVAWGIDTWRLEQKPPPKKRLIPPPVAPLPGLFDADTERAIWRGITRYRSEKTLRLLAGDDAQSEDP